MPNAEGVDPMEKNADVDLPEPKVEDLTHTSLSMLALTYLSQMERVSVLTPFPGKHSPLKFRGLPPGDIYSFLECTEAW